ncbi:MAG: hypothetical protein JSV36_01715 [Anaerolineae bacterium]|nr:MAG: hypothetical protein JSV36_01715 [Anaerolineae bacterium]
MTVWKRGKTCLILPAFVLALWLLPACGETQRTPTSPTTPLAVQSPTLALPDDVTPPIVTIRQELEEQHDMLSALVEAERWRGKDVSQAELRLNEAEDALQADDLAQAREKLREAGRVLGVKLP